MSDVSRKPCETHLTAMKVFMLLLLITSAYDTLNAQALEDDAQDDYAVDYAGKDDEEKPKDNADIPDVAAASVGSSESKSVKKHHHKHSKTHKYWKATVEFLKKTLNPNTLMQNQWFTEMLRKFSHSEDPPEEEMESEEYEEEVHTPPPPPTKRRRGRPRKRPNAGSLEKPGLTGIFKKGLKKISTIDKKKLRRKIRMMKKMARKAKRPLKSVVKFYLSSKNTNNAYGNTGYGAGNTY